MRNHLPYDLNWVWKILFLWFDLLPQLVIKTIVHAVYIYMYVATAPNNQETTPLNISVKLTFDKTYSCVNN